MAALSVTSAVALTLRATSQYRDNVELQRSKRGTGTELDEQKGNSHNMSSY